MMRSSFRSAAHVARLVAGAHGIDLPWLVHGVVAWLVVIVGTQIGIPAVDPRLEVTTRPMEVLGVVVMTWSASVHALPLIERPVWLTATTPRRLTGQRMVVSGAVAALGCFLSWCVAGLLLGDGVPRANVIGVWLLLYSLAAIARTLLGPVAAFLGPAAIVGILSTGAFVPWDWNPVFNTELTPQLWILAPGLLLLGMAIHGLRPPRLRER